MHPTVGGWGILANFPLENDDTYRFSGGENRLTGEQPADDKLRTRAKLVANIGAAVFLSWTLKIASAASHHPQATVLHNIRLASTPPKNFPKFTKCLHGALNYLHFLYKPVSTLPMRSQLERRQSSARRRSFCR